jgi:hypothetical protein
MEWRENFKEFSVVVFAAVILAISASLKDKTFTYYILISLLIILLANTLVKKAIGYLLELKVRVGFWSWYQYGFRKDAHFKKAVPMAWLPLLVSLFSRGFLWWLAILEFDVDAKTERVSRKHGLYRFTEVTEWHVAWIAVFGIIANIALAIIAYFAGFELFSKLCIYYSVWSIVPISSLDGSKIFFGSRPLWMTVATFVLLFFIWGISIL